MAEQYYSFTEYDELVPVLVMLLKQFPAGTKLVMETDDEVFVTIIKKQNGFSVHSEHQGVNQMLDRLNELALQMRGVKVLKPEFKDSEE